MIPNAKYPEIAKGLLEKTRKEQATWKPCGNNKAAGKNTVPASGSEPETTEFILNLPNSVIRLSFQSSRFQPDQISLKFLDKNERIAGTWTVEEDEDAWPIARELCEEVSKQVYGWDKVLVDVEEFIGKSPHTK